ncbi:DUF1631 family protein [Ramlibacter sp. 2FC]|uniref:DUF1631 family protein n=1 Tax=Ramlibacter sp. 2FC TaxID=2502188 RepID=UPI0010F838FA|nr:DUF1631 family protein [Ramlibacter sp. 2FC]
MTAPRALSHGGLLARQARARFVAEVDQALPELGRVALERLGALAAQSAPAQELSERRQALLAFQRLHEAWVDAVRRAWRQPGASAPRPPSDVLELIDNEEVETRIQVSRLALALGDTVNSELNDLRLRVLQLEGQRELAADDAFRPEQLARALLEQWVACGLARDSWTLVQQLLREPLVQRLLEAYHHANEFLVQQGVMPEIDLRPFLRRGGEAATPSRPAPLAPAAPAPAATRLAPPPSERGRAGAAAAAGRMVEPTAQTRLMAPATPPAGARSAASQAAQGVLGQLRRLLGERVGPGDATRRSGLSPALTQALTQAGTASGPLDGGEGLAQLQLELRQRSAELKRKAGTAGEKATVEVVALMFQSILAEERIPASVRVWFARLQMPVLRVALAEPEFFGTLEHPARQLIDRMGSCALGFDAGVSGGRALEAEVRRVVQVIEQYPETGRRVFQLVLDEFQQFLARALLGTERTQRVVSVVQQVEQKETLAIQYTIELRKLLGSVPVRPEIREFLFKVWAEVLAVAAVRHGAQHADTLMLKRAATDLLWTASAKPQRSDRARVVQELPQLLQRLRQGMSLLGLPAQEQEGNLKLISDTVAEAFLSRAELIPQDQLDEMARRLASLDDVVGDAAGDIELDAGSLEMMPGFEHAAIEVVADGGAQASEAMLARAQELQPGHWFTLDRNSEVKPVQFVWRSARRQLHLFVAADGRTCLFQTRRLAAYLQAGLLVPAEDEALTVRATRAALAKLEANPDRLLS